MDIALAYIALSVNGDAMPIVTEELAVGSSTVHVHTVRARAVCGLLGDLSVEASIAAQSNQLVEPTF